jgi:hypothetical protein
MDVEGLAFHPDGTLYGIDDQSLKMFPIDTDTAFIDQNRIINISRTDLTPGSNDFGMTFDCDGNLYITSVAEHSLYRLDSTGATHLVGSLGDEVNISALAAYGNPARLYGLGNGTKPPDEVRDSPILYEIDIDSGNAINDGTAAEIGPLGPQVLDYTQGGLAFDDSGQLWAITDRTQLLESGPSQVMRINTSTGAASEIRNTVERGYESLAIAVPRGCATQGNGDNAAFVVQKRFNDDNNVTPVQLNISCNTGLPLEQSLTVVPNEGAFGHFEVRFIVRNFTDGDLNCKVWEQTPAGYSPDYDCQSASSCSTGVGSGPCSFEGVGNGQESLCLIQNHVDPVDLTVTKEWLFIQEGSVLDDDNAIIELYCADAFDGDGTTAGNGLMYWSWNFNGNPSSHTATVYPDFAGATNCWTVENPKTSAFEPESTCSDGISIGLGDGQRQCTVTNTVFFEGIPTLSQYGLMLFSALMLLTGLFAVRRAG